MSSCSDCNNEYNQVQKKSSEHTEKTAEEKRALKDDWVVLTTVANNIEFEVTSGLLATAGIPCISKVRGIDGYLQVILGVPIAGIDVVVPSERYDEAVKLLEAEVQEEDMKE